MANPPNKKGIVEAISKAKDGIMIEGKWHSVSRKALDYIKDLQRNEEIEYNLDAKENVIFIAHQVRKGNQTPESNPISFKLDDTDKLIVLQAILKAACSAPFVKSAADIKNLSDELLRYIEDKMNGIVK